MRRAPAGRGCGGLPPARPGGAEAGFTLVEIMIVVFIIALMSTLVVMNLPAGKPGAIRSADALYRDLNRAAREAIVSGEPVALAVEGSAYRFERYRAGHWSPTGGVAGTPGTSAPGGLVLEVLAEEEGRPAGARAASARREAQRRSQAGRSRSGPGSQAGFERRLVFSPVGEATPVRILVTDGTHQSAIAVSANGDIRRVATERPGGR